jgi:hypothetical protein
VRRVLNLLVALDQFMFCVLTLGYSDPDETLSSAAYRWEQRGHWMGWLRPAIDTLLWFDPDHCRRSWLNETRN